MTRLVAFLAPRFPGLSARVRACGEEDRMLLLSADSRTRLELKTTGGRLRISLQDIVEDHSDHPDWHSLNALVAELELHRSVSEHVPVAIWRQEPDGRVVWGNAAYWSLAERMETVADLSPGQFPQVFKDLTNTLVASESAHRLQLKLPGESERLWFEVSACTLGADSVFTAVPADTVISAERKLREFTQTLTQTFAHLSVGLAIFDRKRQLTLFNPALGDLLGFDAEFLVARPNLMRFLDQLRERHMMPEPKDYKTWRQQMSDLEAAAAERSHSETWPLPDGRTFRITGRPHPDGAVAFLFEDISAEITLSREFRVELETGQAVIDTMDEAIAVFSADGRMTFANRAYARLWNLENESKTDIVTFIDASRRWQQACMPSPVWGDARDFASEMSGRTTWHAEVRLANGRKVACRFEPLPGGGTMAGFTQAQLQLFKANGTDQGDAVTTAVGHV
ncbi:PAS-domain containing protein [Pseudoruegeria sp. HB172150]|uniref:PAS-domain containing protein n=1 Tax=Pseudoruegeria sp. HB172150 TaxID=2721164 RepID=UPI0015556F11|nr:PAS-domain containing protein [Pseudoruegeria sp. HB172150]